MPPWRGELDGVTQQVAEHLHHLLGIDGDDGRDGRGGALDGEVPLGGQGAEFIGDLRQQQGEVRGPERKIHAPRFQLGEIQEIIEQTEEDLPALINVLEVVPEFLRGGGRHFA